jgi:hypothetical protein
MRWMTWRRRGDKGTMTAEYVVVMMAAVGFAVLLGTVLTSTRVVALVQRLVATALNAAL